MGLPYIKGPSRIPYACGMVGDHHIYPPTASVASILPSNMHLAAQGADFLLFVTMRFADLLSGVCHSVGTEPSLQPVTGEQFEHRTANREDGARLDIVTQSFWGRDRQSAFFDVRVFNPFAPCYRSSTLAQCYRKNELEKKREYEEHVREIEHGSFSPLVFSAAGGMGPIATVMYKRLASPLSEKQGRAYSSTLHWLRCRLNFLLLRSAIMCIQGSRSIFSPESTSSPIESIDLALHEGQVPTF